MQVNSLYCSETVIDAYKLKPGQMVRVQQGEFRINVYMRNEVEISAAGNHVSSKFDELYPSWWPTVKYPIHYMSRAERSLAPEYFVFWDASPVNGAVVILITPTWYDDSEDLSYLGEHWQNGFIDYENQIFYDTTGRPIKWGQKSKYKELSELPLLIPKHEYDERTGTIKIICE
ncbi:hypothetical protein KI743_10265 [Vibrio sp. D420a]|uniref:hypothetical protein n=1 Tax=Vibrio sp. D420a TaxID=2836895 RepID=UPI0025549DAA|nr:hypothetical protein [Vibrio sp. D420a]MDK9762388.1 hypothetical protein [Vibrio sp. D420a]